MKFTRSDIIPHFGTLVLIFINLFSIYNQMNEVIGEIDRNLLIFQVILYFVIFFILKVNNSISSNMELLVWCVFSIIIFIQDLKRRGSHNNNIIGGCEGTRYGCCPDNKTPKNESGSNCKIPDPSSDNTLEQTHNFNNGYSYYSANDDIEIGGLEKDNIYSNYS